MSPLLLLFDLIGTFVFALSGGTLAVRHRLDLFGVLVLSCAAAVRPRTTPDLRVQSRCDPARELQCSRLRCSRIA